MENTWASGAIELLRHADSHIDLGSAFDCRIAFISIDNAVETMIRTFLSLPEAKAGVHVSRKTLEDNEHSFPRLLAVFWQYAGSRLTGIDNADIEHYHRIRNMLYHNGTGLSVDQQYIMAYRQIAIIILRKLFGVERIESRPAPTLEYLIVLWNRLEECFKQRLIDAGIDRRNTFFWEAAIKEGIVTGEDIRVLTELRMIRNKQVHSSSINRKQVEYGIEMAETLLRKLEHGEHRR